MKQLTSLSSQARFLTLLLLGGLLSCTQQPQEKTNTIRLELEGHRYDNLYLQLVLEGYFDRELIIGQSENGYNWEFFYPDSLYGYISDVRFFIPGTPDTVRHDLVFNLISQGDTLASRSFMFDKPSSLVKARYMRTITRPNILMIRQGTTDDIISGTIISDHFEISTSDQNLISSIKSMHYGYGYRYIPKGSTYEEMIQLNMDFIRQYPNSQTMISLLFKGRLGYKSKDDVAKLFNLFSEELQQSFYGQKINSYLTRDNTVFKNQMLTTWDTDRLESIVQDSSKYNLILFSASWCGPCIRQIPIVKEIYQNLRQNLIMTYVSADEQKTVENWREKMRTHEIPWRSLMVLTKEKKMVIYHDYDIPGIPHAILVHPNTMKMEKLNLWEEADRQRLYELVKH